MFAGKFTCFDWFVKLWRTCSFDELGICFEWDDGNWQIPEVQFQSTRDDIDVFIGARWDVCLLAICSNMFKNQEEEWKWRRKWECSNWKCHISTFPSQGELRSEGIVLKQCKKKQPEFYSRVSSIISLACLILTFAHLCMLSRGGCGLLVLADWALQCCELEWHSVMDDLLHADLALHFSPLLQGFSYS